MFEYDLAKAIHTQRIKDAEAYRLAKQVRPAKRRSALRQTRESLRRFAASLQARQPAQRAGTSPGS